MSVRQVLPTSAQQKTVPRKSTRVILTKVIKRTKMSIVWLAQDQVGKEFVVKFGLIASDSANKTKMNTEAVRNEAKWLYTLHNKLVAPDFIRLRKLRHSVKGYKGYYHEVQRPEEYFELDSTINSQSDEAELYAAMQGKPMVFICTKYMAGGTLKDLVEKTRLTDGTVRGLPINQALEITRCIIRCNRQAHSVGFVIIDGKPNNVMFARLTNPGEKIGRKNLTMIDAGIAAQIGQKTVKLVEAFWAGPELQSYSSQGSIKANPQMDVYPIGMMLRYQLNGEHARDLEISKREERLDASQIRFPWWMFPWEKNRLTALINDFLVSSLASEPLQRLTLEEFDVHVQALQRTLRWAWWNRFVFLPILCIMSLVFIAYQNSNNIDQSFSTTFDFDRTIKHTPSPLPEKITLTPNAIAFNPVVKPVVTVQSPITPEVDSAISAIDETPTGAGNLTMNDLTILQPLNLTTSTLIASSLIPITLTPSPTVTKEVTIVEQSVPTSTLGPTSTPTATEVRPTRSIGREETQTSIPSEFRLTEGNCNGVQSWQEQVTLTWQAAPLEKGHGYELIAWKNQDNDPLEGGQAPGIGKEATTESTISFNAHTVVIDSTNVVARHDEEYYWGILLVQLEPYKRLKLLTSRDCKFKVPSSKENGSSKSATDINRPSASKVLQ